LKGEASNIVCKPHSAPISNKIGTASKSAACTSAENIVAEDVSLNAAVKLFETDADTNTDKLDDGTDIPSVSSTARITWTKFFWTVRRFRNREDINKRMTSDTYRCHS
jgi:hypothetical protein